MNALAANGAHVFGLASSSAGARDVCDQIGPRATPVACDLADLDSVAAAAHQANPGTATHGGHQEHAADGTGYIARCRLRLDMAYMLSFECVKPSGDGKTPFPRGDISALKPITFGAKVCPPGGGKE